MFFKLRTRLAVRDLDIDENNWSASDEPSVPHIVINSGVCAAFVIRLVISASRPFENTTCFVVRQVVSSLQKPTLV
jgi:hypothetical protein